MSLRVKGTGPVLNIFVDAGLRLRRSGEGSWLKSKGRRYLLQNFVAASALTLDTGTFRESFRNAFGPSYPYTPIVY